MSGKDRQRMTSWTGSSQKMKTWNQVLKSGLEIKSWKAKVLQEDSQKMKTWNQVLKSGLEIKSWNPKEDPLSLSTLHERCRSRSRWSLFFVRSSFGFWFFPSSLFSRRSSFPGTSCSVVSSVHFGSRHTEPIKSFSFLVLKAPVS